MSEIKKYKFCFKYPKYPEFNLETTATSEKEAREKLIQKIIQNHPELEAEDILYSSKLESYDPY